MGDLPLFKTKADEEIYSLKSELRSYKSSHGLMQSQIQQLEQEVKELKALLAEIYDIGDLREYLLEYVPEMEQAKKALAQHNKQVSIKAIEELKHRIIECREMELSQCDVYTIGLIAEQFKQGFDIFETPDSV